MQTISMVNTNVLVFAFEDEPKLSHYVDDARHISHSEKERKGKQSDDNEKMRNFNLCQVES